MYRESSTAIRVRDTTLIFKEQFHKFINYELFLKDQNLEKSPSTITVAVAQKTNFKIQHHKNNHRFFSQSWKPSMQ